ncbi:hypothetical protein [Pedobacter sp. MW01-1-1]|uniref:hypothetical protein n=1 Tax=Pedobacter sp. MW01-1-1 TaxID=3383027 RepID=UPI003FED63CE
MAKQNEKNSVGEIDLTPNPNHIGEVSQNVLDNWKQKYDEVTIIEVDLGNGKKSIGYYKKPTRAIVANCVNDATAGKHFEAREFLAQNTWLGGDGAQQTNDDIAIPAQTQLWASLNFYKAASRKF